MTKKIVNFLFYAYQAIFRSPQVTCRFQPTCSLYAKQAIEKYGLLKGSILALRRILSCNPFSSRPLYDPA